MEPVADPQPADATDPEVRRWAAPTYRVHSVKPQGGPITGRAEGGYGIYRPS
jgi:hypothetical protein